MEGSITFNGSSKYLIEDFSLKTPILGPNEIPIINNSGCF